MLSFASEELHPHNLIIPSKHDAAIDAPSFDREKDVIG